MESFADELQNTPQLVKAKILERMADWTEMFSKNPDLEIMEQTYMKLKTQSKSVRLSCGAWEC